MFSALSTQHEPQHRGYRTQHRARAPAPSTSSSLPGEAPHDLAEPSARIVDVDAGVAVGAVTWKIAVPAPGLNTGLKLMLSNRFINSRLNSAVSRAATEPLGHADVEPHERRAIDDDLRAACRNRRDRARCSSACWPARCSGPRARRARRSRSPTSGPTLKARRVFRMMSSGIISTTVAPVVALRRDADLELLLQLILRHADEADAVRRRSSGSASRPVPESSQPPSEASTTCVHSAAVALAASDRQLVGPVDAKRVRHAVVLDEEARLDGSSPATSRSSRERVARVDEQPLRQPAAILDLQRVVAAAAADRRMFALPIAGFMTKKFGAQARRDPVLREASRRCADRSPRLTGSGLIRSSGARSSRVREIRATCSATGRRRADAGAR